MTGLTSDDEIMGALDALPQPEAPQPSFTGRLAHVFSQAADTAGALQQFNAENDPGIALGRAVGEDVGAPGFGERFGANLRAAYTRAIEADNLTGDDVTIREQYAPLVEAANKGLPPEQWLANPYDRPVFGGPFANRQSPGPSRDQAEALLWSRIDQLRKTDPGAAGNLPKDKAELMEDVRAEQRTAISYADLLAQHSGPVSGGVAQFVGGAAGAQQDAPNLLASMGGPASSSLLRTFLTEGALNAAADIAGLPTRMNRYQSLGLDFTPDQAAEEAAGAFVLGGALPTAAKGVGHVFLDGAPLLDAFDRAIPNAPPVARTARAIVEDGVNIHADNPFAATDAGADLHRQALDASATALDRGAPVAAPGEPLARALDPKVEAGSYAAGRQIEAFGTGQLKTDAAQMQYKGGGDAAGVTGILRGTEEWDPAAAGMILVYRTRDGQNIIANGHQRFGLARDLEANGHPPITLYGRVLNEADGYTPQDARVIGALVNIKEGSGSAIDAARVLRDAPDKATGLPPRSPFVRQAQSLRNLGDDAWGIAVNGVASERDAAIVGRMVNDHTMQAAILSHLAKDSPDTAQEAELFVRHALAAGATKDVQADMFGDFLKTDLVLPERVKILAATVKALRRDKSLFTTLTGREGEIAAAGNKLDTLANAERQQAATRTLAVLEALAERKGPISDALQQAAEASLRSGDRRAAIRQFSQDVRERVGRGELDGGADRGAGGGVLAEPEASSVSAEPEREGAQGVGRPRQDEADLSLFGDPANKPDAFRQQAQDLARELAPETAPRPELKPKSADVQKNGGEIPVDAKPEFGPAQPEIDALRAMDQKHMFADPAGDGEISVREARAEIERQARATEFLRGCVEGE